MDRGVPPLAALSIREAYDAADVSDEQEDEGHPDAAPALDRGAQAPPALARAHTQMARELGMNPKKFGSIANHHQEPWKLPLPQFIHVLLETPPFRAGRKAAVCAGVVGRRRPGTIVG
jgi:hypothetical protein